MTADKRAEAAEVEASGPTLVIENGWLCEAVNEHTCGTAAGGYYGAHEPGCGLVPIADIGDLLARRLAEARAEVIDAVEETFLGQLPSKALSYCAQEDVNAGLDALRERFGLDGDGR